MVVLTKKKNVSKSRTKIRTKSKSNFKLKNSLRTSKVMRGGATSVPKRNFTLKRKEEERHRTSVQPQSVTPQVVTPKNLLWRSTLGRGFGGPPSKSTGNSMLNPTKVKREYVEPPTLSYYPTKMFTPYNNRKNLKKREEERYPSAFKQILSRLNEYSN